MDPMQQGKATSGGGGGPLARVLRLPLRYPITVVWAVLMLVLKSGVLEGVPAVLSGVSAVAAPFMIPAYIVGIAWLGVGQQLGFGEGVPLWFEVLGVLIVAGAYVLIDRLLWRFRSLATQERLGLRRRL